MEPAGSGETIRHESARRYADWLAERMRVNDWKQADVSRRSGLKKQTVGQILRGESFQPTAWQIASLARAFGVDPNAIYQIIGLWEGSPGDPLSGDVAAVYRGLRPPAKRALLQVGRTLREMQSEYELPEAGKGEKEAQLRETRESIERFRERTEHNPDATNGLDRAAYDEEIPPAPDDHGPA